MMIDHAMKLLKQAQSYSSLNENDVGRSRAAVIVAGVLVAEQIGRLADVIGTVALSLSDSAKAAREQMEREKEWRTSYIARHDTVSPPVIDEQSLGVIRSGVNPFKLRGAAVAVLDAWGKHVPSGCHTSLYDAIVQLRGEVG